MKCELDEVQAGHIYSALGVAGNEWQKVKKSLAKLNKEDPTIDAEIALNAHLRRLFNPKAEEEARVAEQKKRDAAQLDLTDPNYTGSSGETGGGAPAGETFKTKLRLEGSEEKVPTDEELRDVLLLADRMVLLSDIRGWTSSERDAAVRYANVAMNDDKGEEPECVGLVALSHERIEELNKGGPHLIVEMFSTQGAAHQDEPSSYKIMLLGSVVDGQPTSTEVIELVDGVEAEVKCARLNRDFIKHADMDAKTAIGWLGAGPWSVMGEPAGIVEGEPNVDRWFVVHDEQKERATSLEDANYTAAKYNRTIAGRDSDGNWREPPVTITEDAAQEIKAAAESTE